MRCQNTEISLARTWNTSRLFSKVELEQHGGENDQIPIFSQTKVSANAKSDDSKEYRGRIYTPNLTASLRRRTCRSHHRPHPILQPPGQET
jgi:hypothetical protein